jgi:hypothetical protein
MGMSHATSGRLGYADKCLSPEEYNTLLKGIKNEYRKLTIADLKEDIGEEEYPSLAFLQCLVTIMLTLENDLRNSSEFQHVYHTEINANPFYGYQIASEAVQNAVAKEINMSIPLCTSILQNAHVVTDKAQSISLYRKFNHMCDGSLHIDDTAPNVRVHDFGDSQLPLISLFPRRRGDARPSVMIAGSYS